MKKKSVFGETDCHCVATHTPRSFSQTVVFSVPVNGHNGTEPAPVQQNPCSSDYSE